MYILLEDLVIEERIREDLGTDEEWKQFLNSFVVHGQLQPIRVEALPDNKWKLIAGGRRATAIMQLNVMGKKVKGLEAGMIEATLGKTVPLHTKMLQEFAENNERKDFTFIEKAKFIRKFHEMMQLEHGPTNWSQELTARSLNISAASISHYLRVEEAAKNDESIGKATTLNSAVKRMKTKEALERRHEAVKNDSNDALERAASILHLGDARDWLAGLEDESVDFINFDPPWGDNASHKSAAHHEAFDDSTEYADKLMLDLFPHLFRVLRNDRFCVFWHRAWATQDMAKLAEGFGFNLTFTRTPAMWFKPDKVADANRNPEKQLIEAYEPFYLLRKGDPVFHERYTNNVFPFDRVPVSQLIHPTEKPIELCSAILKLCTVPGELVIDPTAGSAAMLDSALRNNRKAKGCELSENFHQRGSTRLAEYLKTFREKKIA